ncbi:ATP-binding cassette domain-containing protein [Shimia sp. CNT1-13L.2]|uniref:energy-coupling factor ABC transporter ATP-binding protein n=1 Tax=Shimia sp. CNT1-13L.2 TaxID=2959663 RepID=UPI0020CDAE87|nr:ATP-binding cassette domain-containing protein [Shimia sp. CNT1-13L.2]MCP9480506.1 ATP-binding cassette domain-containing protein [Shimia sp. CNT1-13L.2]
MIEVQNVTLSYGDRRVLHDISLSLSERRIAIIGANGSGKSSFARLLNGLVLPTSGDVLIDGQNTRTHGKDIRQKVGFVFQNPDNQIVFPVVEEDLAFGMKNLGFSKEDIARKTDEILARYDMSDLREHPAHLLSGGQKQLLAISGVLVMEPAYVVMDEPTTLLDLRNKRRVARAVDAIDQTVIFVSHDLDLLHDFDRVVVFDEGRVIADDTPDKAIPLYVDRMS